jgi:hypothetical protein
MDFGLINWLAVVASVIASIVIGSIWYHPAVFYKTWLAGIGKSWENRFTGNMTTLFGFTILASLVEAVALAFMLKTMGSVTAGSGAAAGFMLWLGFVAPTNLVNKLYAGHGWKVWLIEAGEHLLYLLVAGAILGVWH